MLALVAGGLSDEEIAGTDPEPAHGQDALSRIMNKLSARDHAQLVVLAYETGFVLARGRPPGTPAKPPVVVLADNTAAHRAVLARGATPPEPPAALRARAVVPRRHTAAHRAQGPVR